MALAGFLGWAVGDLLGIGEKFTAISAIIVAQAPSIGKSLIRTRRRLLGSIVGVAFGGLALALVGSGPWQMFLAIFVSYVVAGLVGLADGARVAALGALAVVIAPIGGPLHSAVFRFLDIAVGAVIALAVTLVVYPRRAEADVVSGFAEIPDRLSRKLRPVVEAGCGKQASERAEGLKAEISELRERIIELAPLIRQSEHEPGARHRRPALVAEGLQRLLAASEAVAQELTLIRDEAPEPFSLASAELGAAICDQLEAASVAIADGHALPPFPSASPLSLALYGATEAIAENPDGLDDTRQALRLIALSAELRRLAHLVEAMEGLSVEVVDDGLA